MRPFAKVLLICRTSDVPRPWNKQPQVVNTCNRFRERLGEECETAKPEEGGKRACTKVTRNGVTFYLNTYVGNVENVDEEPVYEAYSDSQPFACTFP